MQVNVNLATRNALGIPKKRKCGSFLRLFAASVASLPLLSHYKMSPLIGVFYAKLDATVLVMHIADFLVACLIPNDCRSQNDCQVFRGH